MSKKAVIIGMIILLILAIAIPAAVYLTGQQQVFKSRAQSTDQTATGGACQPPAAVTNVKVAYPVCQGGVGGDCSFTTANCTWDAVPNAVSYNVTITEVDTSKVIKTDNLSANTTSEVFPVTQNFTYRCDVSAISTCGATGQVGSATQICKVPAIFASASPSPSPSASPSPTPVVTPGPTVAPTPAPISCGYSSCAVTPCAAGLNCVAASNSQSYCARPAYMSACAQNPSIATCCNAPAQPVVARTPAPTLPVSGDSDNTLMLVGIGAALIAFAAISMKVVK